MCPTILSCICSLEVFGAVSQPSDILSSNSISNALPTLDQALAAKQDIWGLPAMRQPNGPNYEFFSRLLPPLRYVNAAFRHYPIVLSAPGSAQKARLVSNGSAITVTTRSIV